MLTIDFPVKIKLRIDWSEIDIFGHVNNVTYYKYIQAARVEYVEKLGMMQTHRETNIGPTLASCKCDFKFHYISLENHCSNKVDFIKTQVLVSAIRLLTTKNQIAAEAQDILVMLDFNTNKKVRISDELRKKIEELEKKTFK